MSDRFGQERRRARSRSRLIRRAARQEQFLEVVSAEEARARFERHLDLVAACRRSASRLRPRSAACSRMTSPAPIDVPPFDRSERRRLRGARRRHRRRERRRAAPLRLNAEVLVCGHAPALEVAPGTATTIATGGVVPRGADAVVMIEQHRAGRRRRRAGDRRAPRRRARPVRLLCGLRHRARRDACCGAARASARARSACWRPAASPRSRWCGGRRWRCSRPATSWSRRASRCGRPRSTTATARSSRPRCRRPAASRCRSARSRTTRPRSSVRCARALADLRHGGALGRHLEGRGRSLASRRLAARRARHPRAWRRAQARQAALPRGRRRQAGRGAARVSRPRRSSPSTPSSRR